MLPVPFKPSYRVMLTPGDPSGANTGLRVQFCPPATGVQLAEVRLKIWSGSGGIETRTDFVAGEIACRTFDEAARSGTKTVMVPLMRASAAPVAPGSGAH